MGEKLHQLISWSMNELHCMKPPSYHNTSIVIDTVVVFVIIRPVSDAFPGIVCYLQHFDSKLTLDWDSNGPLLCNHSYKQNYLYMVVCMLCSHVILPSLASPHYPVYLDGVVCRGSLFNMHAYTKQDLFAITSS